MVDQQTIFQNNHQNLGDFVQGTVIIIPLRPNDHASDQMNKTIIGSDNGMSPVRHQAIIWIKADLFSITP